MRYPSAGQAVRPGSAMTRPAGLLDQTSRRWIAQAATARASAG
jgi:hypothetical protein